MTENNFTEKLITRIKSENIAPRPRWHFLLKNYMVWLSGVLALLFGSVGVSVIIYLLKYNDWEMGLRAHKSFWEFLLLTMPYFWLVFLGLFIFILYYNLKHTKKGYRYPLSFIVSFAVLSSIIVGEVFFLVGLGEKIDNVLGSRAPFYKEVFNPQLDFWFNPRAGRLAGVIISTSSGLHLIDPAGKDWEILVGDDGQLVNRLSPGSPINITGKMISDNSFAAEFIKPAARPGRAFMDRQRAPFAPNCQTDHCPRGMERK